MGTAIRRSVRQGRDHRRYWDRPQRGELTYLALGDSAAVGVGVGDPRRGYVGVLADRLAKDTGRTVRTVNLAVSGATAATLLRDQIPQLADVPNPDFVTCVIGGNDVAWEWWRRSHTFADPLRRIARRLPAGSVLGTVPSFGHWPYEGWARRANGVIHEEAYSNGHLVADLYTPTRRLWPWRYRHILAGDLFHPNAAGHTLWADAIWPLLSPHQAATH
ncbi:SGNH/GDSL hydrolase family protein [Spiractinospora alimapuensis]|uniref:SGNH/GDSL hydrolase family protein n=1 Tax=Spiractinospora alimapuensis TaxID=2820884 RepID=UPI001F34C125|nr:SGNH/GDSL hydrolase family protein [Spiractinospora alimapuensis]QVQ51543.1 SGNH/GDSL hydrolase family protein [Spiractinospora alimapuensis]